VIEGDIADRPVLEPEPQFMIGENLDIDDVDQRRQLRHTPKSRTAGRSGPAGRSRVLVPNLPAAHRHADGSTPATNAEHEAGASLPRSSRPAQSRRSDQHRTHENARPDDRARANTS